MAAGIASKKKRRREGPFSHSILEVLLGKKKTKRTVCKRVHPQTRTKALKEKEGHYVISAEYGMQ